MVQLMNSGKKTAIKFELDHSLEDQLGPLHKRPKFIQQEYEYGTAGFQLPPTVYNPLEEPSPLGLQLKKSPSFLDLIEMTLSQEKASKLSNLTKNNQKNGADKLKAANFAASLLKIGSWEYKSRYEGDLVGKCYFAKHKLVWEVLDGGLKNKIEVQWSDIMDIKAKFSDDGPDSLDVLLARQPLFFRETNPQPRKHTLWQATSDFTGGQASIHRRHFLLCPKGLLARHFEKLIQCDPRLNFLSQQPEMTLESPYFESRVPLFDETDVSSQLQGEEGALSSDLQDGASPCGVQSTSSNVEQLEFINPSSASVGEMRNTGAKDLKMLNQWDHNHNKIPGLHPSISMTDFLNQIEHCISEQKTSGNTNVISGHKPQGRDLMEDITQCLLSDANLTSTSNNEQSILSRVNSLCCLLQKDSTPSSGNLNFQAESNEQHMGIPETKKAGEANNGPAALQSHQAPPTMSRKNSVAELLHNLPRIASLPQVLFNFSEDTTGIER